MISQELARSFHSILHKPAMRRDPRGLAECTGKVPRREPAFCRETEQRDVLFQVGGHQFLGEALLMGRQTPALFHFAFVHSPVHMGYMSGQCQRHMI